jgi:hypothetical protein
MTSNITIILYYVLTNIIHYTQAAAFSNFSNSKDITPNLTIKWKLEQNDLILYAEKKKKGHLWIGLGNTNNKGNIFKITKINQGSDLKIENCLINRSADATCPKNNEVIIEHKEVSIDGFKIQIRTKIDPKIVESPTQNAYQFHKVIYSYSDSDEPV